MKIPVGRLKNLVKRNLFIEAAVGEGHAKKTMKQFVKGMSKLGISLETIDSLPILGVGTHGTAFEMPDGRVLKITNDGKEANTSSMLIGQDVKNIVKFYDVWEFGDTGLYGIIQEKVFPIEKNEAKEFNDALVATGLPIWIRRAPEDWEKVKESTKDYIIKKVKKKFPDNHNSPEAQQFAHEVNGQWNQLINKFGVRNMFNTLNQLGIDFHDYHAGNLMKKQDGTLVLIDLGISIIRGDGSGKMRAMTEMYDKMGL